jgi:ribosomal protein S12 methylthiotransferase accessory factor
MSNFEETLIRVAPLVRKAGITRIANITGLDSVGIHVALATRPSSRSLSVSQGKGVTLHHAKMSALMESLEQFHAERVRHPVRLASFLELSSERRVVDTARLPRGSRAFSEHARLLWITARDLETDEPVEVPFELVHLDFTLPLPEGSGYFAIGSNGLASGADLVSATSHGLWELIERDALALFYERSPAAQAERRVRVDSVDDPTCVRLLHKFDRAGIGVAVWDMTTEIGLPAFLCSVGEREFDPLHRIGTARGYGCHVSRGVALRRALTEAAQSRLTRIAGSRDDIRPEDLERILDPTTIAHQLDHLAHEADATRRFDDAPSNDFEAAEDALSFTRAQLALAGFRQALRVDLSPADEAIAVVRCIVPGLEGFPDAHGYVPGERALAIRKAATS